MILHTDPGSSRYYQAAAKAAHVKARSFYEAMEANGKYGAWFAFGAIRHQRSAADLYAAARSCMRVVDSHS